jgi:hypothetical protein
MRKSANQLRKFFEEVAQLKNLWVIKDAEGFHDVKPARYQTNTIIRFFLGIFSVMMLQGCQLIEQTGSTGSLHATHVRIQICLPMKVVDFDEIRLDHLKNYPGATHYSTSELALAPNTVRRMKQFAILAPSNSLCCRIRKK